MADAHARGDRGFLLGNGTGTGKTFVALGAVKQLGTPRTLIVVPNQAIAKQWQDAAHEHFGLNLTVGSPPHAGAPGVYIITYAGLRTHGAPGQFGLAIYDEVHREGTKLREGGKTAKLVADLSDRSRFAVYSTATPYEPPYQLMYLGPLGLWPAHRRGAFKDWAAAHGVRWDVETVPTPYGPKEVSKPKFVGTKAGKVADMLRVRAAIVGAGKGVFRELVVDQPLTASFQALPVASGAFGATVARALDAVETMAIPAAQQTNLRKRLLDYPKLDAAVTEAVDQARAGKRVAVFVSNKMGFDFERGLTDEEIEEGGGDASAIKREIRRAFQAAGLTGELPSPTTYLAERLTAHLGAGSAAEYTGDITDAKRAKIKAAFQAGKLQAVVATIAAGGTGLSLHDTVGDAPRHQINVGLPWTGKDFAQLVGRTYRLGTRSPVTHRYLVTDHPAEKRLAAKVGGRLAQLRAGVSGVTQDTNAASLLGWAMGVDDEGGTLMKSVRLRLPGLQAPAWWVRLMKGGVPAPPLRESSSAAPAAAPAPARPTRRALMQRKTAIESDLFFLDEEQLPALTGDDSTSVLLKAELTSRRAALLGELLAIDAALLKADRAYEAETARIRRRKQTPEAQRPHRFQAATWTHPNGHPRCRLCGDEEPEGGQCPGRDLVKAHQLHYRRTVDGVGISIENRRGSLRHWRDHDGTEGTTKLPAPYGYARGSRSIDGDQHDVFLGPLARTGQIAGTTVYIVTTRKPPRFAELDEQKHLVGFPDLAAAKAVFLASYGGDPRFIAQIDTLPWETWKQEVRATGQQGATLVHGTVVERGVPILKARLVMHAKTPPARDVGPALARLRPALAHVVEELARLFPDVPVAGRIKDTGGPPESGGVPEDLASARLTFATAEDQQLALGRIRRSFEVSKEQDYVAHPKGAAHYRGVHLVVTVDGLPIEVQLRTARQTQWATYVHDVVARLGSQAVPAELVPYLRALSDAYAAEDGGDEAEIPECPPDIARKYGCPEDLEEEAA